MEFSDQLKSSINIVSVIGQYVSTLKKSGRDTYKGLCPFHQEKTPSFNVHEGKQFFYCFGCQASGDVLEFVMEIEGISFYEALKELAERNGIPMPKRAQYADDDSRLREALFHMHEMAAGALSRQPERPGGRSGARLPGAPRAEAGDHRTIRAGLFRPLRPRAAAPLRGTAQLHAAADGGIRPGAASAKTAASTIVFRNRLMFPIHNESGKIIGFGGRGLAAKMIREVSKFAGNADL